MKKSMIGNECDDDTNSSFSSNKAASEDKSSSCGDYSPELLPPHYLKATSSSVSKKLQAHHSDSLNVGNINKNSRVSWLKTVKSLSRSSRSVRVLIRKTSFKPQRDSLKYSNISEGVAFDKATHSSTLKDSKFVEAVENAQLEPNHCCRYHHCSVHGHRHDDSNIQADCTLVKRGRSNRRQKGVKPKKEFLVGESESIIVPLDDKNDFYSCADVYFQMDDLSLFETAFGETSFPERASQENLDIMEKYELHARTAFGMNGYCLRCYTLLSDQSGEQANTPVRCAAMSHEVMRDDSFVSKTTGSVNSGEGKLKTDTAPSGDTKVDDATQVVEDLKTDCPTHDGIKLQLSKPGHISLWNLIYQNLSSNSAAESSKEPFAGFDGENSRKRSDTLLKEEVSVSSKEFSNLDTAMINDSEAQAIEGRKEMAIKLVRDAIEKILLPEVQGLSSDNHSMTGDYVTGSECIKEHGKESKASDADKGEVMASGQVDQIPLPGDSAGGVKGINRALSSKTAKAAVNQWSNLKKWILLHKFIKELEKVRTLDIMSPQIESSNFETRAETITLRPYALEGRKSAEEWMLDYAIRQAVGQLAPTQKKKVALLVKAFETVAPAREYSHVAMSGAYGNDITYGEDVTGSMLTKETAEVSLASDNACQQSDQYKQGNVRGAVGDTNHVKDDTIELPGIEAGGSAPNHTELKMEDGVVNSSETPRSNHIKMWHMIYQHVVSSVAEKVGIGLLDGYGSEAEEAENANTPPVSKNDAELLQKHDGKDLESDDSRSGLTKSDIVRLIKETVHEILVARDEAFKAPSPRDDQFVLDQEAISSGDRFPFKRESETSVEQLPKPRKWSRLKNALLVKGSIKALEEARKKNNEADQLSSGTPEKVNLKSQMIEERKKAEAWMVDYAVQNIVTKLTPARKRRVSMLVEAFEAVIPFPEM